LSALRRRARGLAGLACALLLAACAGTPARDPAPVQAEHAPAPAGPAKDAHRSLARACHEVDAAEVAVLDETRRRLEETTCGAALWFDSLFGEGDVRAARQTHGQVEVAVAHSDFEGWNTRVRFNAHIRVPSLEDRFSAFVGRDNEQEFVRDRSEGLGLRTQFPAVDQQDAWMAGLGYSLPEAYKVHIDLRAGVHGLSPPTAFVQARIGYTPFSDDHGLVHLRGTPFVNTFDGLGFTGSLDIDRLAGESMLLRWGSIGTVSQKSAGLDWRTALILYQNLHQSRALAYEVFIRGATSAPETIHEYGGRTIYRQPIVRDRLIGEFIVGYSWPKNDPTLARKGSFGTSVGITLPFGGDEPLARN
jgi:hypothetical protein